MIRRRPPLAALVAALSVALVACEDSPTQLERNPITGVGGSTVLIQLQGTLRSAVDSLPIEGVAIVISDFQGTRRQRISDAAGRYALDVAFRKPCSMVLLSVAMENDDGWVGQTRTLSCVPQLRQLDFYLEPGLF